MKRTDRRPAAGLQPKTAGKPPARAGADTAGKAVARLKHEVRHERPMTDWGKGGKGVPRRRGVI